MKKGTYYVQRRTYNNAAARTVYLENQRIVVRVRLLDVGPPRSQTSEVRSQIVAKALSGLCRRPPAEFLVPSDVCGLTSRTRPAGARTARSPIPYPRNYVIRNTFYDNAPKECCS